MIRRLMSTAVCSSHLESSTEGVTNRHCLRRRQCGEFDLVRQEPWTGAVSHQVVVPRLPLAGRLSFWRVVLTCQFVAPWIALGCSIVIFAIYLLFVVEVV